MDTDELSDEAHKGIIIEAETFLHDLTLHFGLLSYECTDEEEYLTRSLRLIKDLRTCKKDDYPDILYGSNPTEKSFHKTLNKIEENILAVSKIPLQERTFSRWGPPKAIRKIYKFPDPIYPDSIDRNAIIVRPKKPLFDWLNSVILEREPMTETVENSIYLIHEKDNNEVVVKWIKRNFNKIFMEELYGWITDDSVWPKSRTYKMFSEWFDVEICSMIIDLEDDEVTKK